MFHSFSEFCVFSFFPLKGGISFCIVVASYGHVSLIVESARLAELSISLVHCCGVVVGSLVVAAVAVTSDVVLVMDRAAVLFPAWDHQSLLDQSSLSWTWYANSSMSLCILSASSDAGLLELLSNPSNLPAADEARQEGFACPFLTDVLHVQQTISLSSIRGKGSFPCVCRISIHVGLAFIVEAEVRGTAPGWLPNPTSASWCTVPSLPRSRPWKGLIHVSGGLS